MNQTNLQLYNSNLIYQYIIDQMITYYHDLLNKLINSDLECVIITDDELKNMEVSKILIECDKLLSLVMLHNQTFERLESRFINITKPFIFSTNVPNAL